MAEVPIKRTPVERHVATLELRDAAPDLSDNQLALMLAQLHLETAGFQKMDNNNPGNITTRDNAGHAFYRPRWYEDPGPDGSEQLKRLHALMLQGQAPRAFRAFDTFPEGIAAYVSLLRRRYPTLLSAKTPEEYADRIKSSGYTPDAPPGVRRTLRAAALQYGYQDNAAGGSRNSSAFLLGLALVAGAVYTLRRKQ